MQPNVCQHFLKMQSEIGETGRELTEFFHEHMGIPIEAAKPVSLDFNSPDHQSKANIYVTALKSCHITKEVRVADTQSVLHKIHNGHICHEGTPYVDSSHLQGVA